MRRDLEPYERIASDFLSAHRTEEPVVAAVDWLRRYIARGPYLADLTAAEVARVRNAKVDPFAILVRLQATWLAAAWGASSKIANDRDALTFALAHAFGRVAPRFSYKGPSGGTFYRDAGATAKREVGTRIREGLGLLFMGATKAIAAADAKDRALRDAMAKPFEPVTTTLAAPISGTAPTTTPLTTTRSGAIRSDH